MTTFRYFGSGMSKPFNMLSNFSECEIVCNLFIEDGNGGFIKKDYTFPSSEHVWWSHFMYRDCDISRLAVGGDLSTVNGLEVILGKYTGEKKAKYWGKKDNVGIVPKMLASRMNKKTFRPRAKSIGIEMTMNPHPWYGEHSDDNLDAIWTKILVLKYSQNKDHRRVLQSTSGENLVEFCRMYPEKQFWAGQVEGGVKHKNGKIEGGSIVGRNYMGDMMVKIRGMF